VVSDEAGPTVLGFTKEVRGEESCGWVFKKEHLRLSEVPVILKRLNQDKQVSDCEAGRKPHAFFLPHGSKILVSSYVQLCGDGLDSYVDDFNKMVKELWSITGDIGVELLPVCPVIFPNLDKVGGNLICGLRDWINWTADTTGRPELRYLAETGGHEVKEDEQAEVIIYQPQCTTLKSQPKGCSELSNRGNMIQVSKGEPREVRVCPAALSKDVTLKMNSEKQVRVTAVNRKGARLLKVFHLRVSIASPPLWRASRGRL